MPRNPRHCPICHHETSDERFRIPSEQNPSVEVHECPVDVNPQHTFEECPTHYEKGHQDELKEEKARQKQQQRDAKQHQMQLEKELREREKTEKKQKKEEEKARKKAEQQRLREERLADVIPEFEEYCREIGLEEEDSPEYLAQMLEACRGFLRQRRQRDENPRKRKRVPLDPPQVSDIISRYFGDEPPPKKLKWDPTAESSSESDSDEELINRGLLNNTNRNNEPPPFDDVQEPENPPATENQPRDPLAAQRAVRFEGITDEDFNKLLDMYEAMRKRNNNN